MSFYSSGDVKSELIEPSVHNPNDRTEFRIHGSVLSKVKLINFGLIQPAGTASQYLDDVGALGCIRNLYIYDGKQLLTGVKGFNDYAAFKNQIGDNRSHSDIDTLTKRNRIGFRNVFKNDVDSDYRRETIAAHNQQDVFSTTDSTTNTYRGYLNLAECFDMLQKVPVLSDQVFKQLRIVIEYESDVARKQKATNVATQASRPLLAVDRIMNPQLANGLLSQLKTATWSEYETDRMSVPAIAAGSATTPKKLLGFNGKSLMRLRVRKSYASNASYENANAVVGYGQYSSMAGSNETIQVRVNGRNLFSRGGLTGKNRTLAMLNDSYGNINMKEDDHLVLVDDCPIQDAVKKGQQSNIGVAVGEKILDLQLEYTRSFITDGTSPSPYKDALTLHCEGEVLKTMSLGNGGYMISYA